MKDYQNIYQKHKHKYSFLKNQTINLKGGKSFKSKGAGNNNEQITNYDINFINRLKSFHDIKKIYKELIDPNLNLYEYSQIPNIISYAEATRFINLNCHFGQRKLLLTEIEYYNMLDQDKNYLIIYPGSASCEHLPVILQLFPNLKFLLIDPNYHSIDHKYPFKYIYQNTPVISSSNLKLYRSQLRFNKPNVRSFFDKRNLHLKQTAQLLLKVNFLNKDNTYNVLNLDENKGTMKQIMEKFMEDSNNLVSDIYKDEDRVFIIQDYMSIDLTERIKKSYDMYKKNDEYDIEMCFLSDIRTSLFRDGNPTDLDIIWNYALQIIFIKILQPKYSMTKFRPPWFDEGDLQAVTIIKMFKEYNEGKKVDFSLVSDTPHLENMFIMVKKDFDFVKSNYDVDMFGGYLNHKTYYFENDFIFTQAWAPPKSGETRVFVSKKNINNFVTYDATEWENKFYFIRYIRTFSYFGIFYELLKNERGNDYDGCYDCYRELLVLGNYLAKDHQKAKFNGVLDVKKIEEAIRDNIPKLLEMYELINKYVYYDLKPNFKCMFHHNTIKKPDYLIANFASDNDDEPYIYGIRIDENTKDTITENDIIYKYKYEFSENREEFISQFKIDSTKNNLYFVKR
jgi:hypothetical protein